MKSTSEYSMMCGADVFVRIRLKESGRLYPLLSEHWSTFASQLVSLFWVYGAYFRENPDLLDTHLL
jgi:hypothetical protein